MGKQIHLKYSTYEVLAKSVDIDPETKKVSAIHVEATNVGNKPIKGRAVIHFVAQYKPGVEPTKAEFRLYNELFKSPEPMGIDEWEKDLNPNSLVIQHGFIDQFTLANAQCPDVKEKQYQFERVGYFIVDKDSTPSNLVFNRTCQLRATAAAAATSPTAK